MSWRDVVSNSKFLTFLLDTPSTKWVVVRGVHFHKSFWGSLLVLGGISVLAIFDAQTFGLIMIAVGLIYTALSIIGHIYTYNKPYFKWWDVEQK